MSNRVVAALGAATLTVGILVGAAGAVLVGNTTTPDRMGMDGSMGAMMTMMGGSMMGGADFDDMAGWHAQHRGTGR
ncbi:MAG: hypothetical protein R6W93_08850 [Candidatus Limnocylindrales bacterium]